MVVLVNNAWLGTGVGRYVDAIFSRFLRDGKNIEMTYLNNGRPYGLQNPHIKEIKGPPLKAEINNYFYFPARIQKGGGLYHITNESIGRCCTRLAPCIATCMDAVPFVWESNYGRLMRFFRKMQFLSLARASRIITVSESTRKDVLRLFTKDSEDVITIHFGVDQSVFYPMDKTVSRKLLGLPLNRKIILTVGVDHPRKNVPTILRTLSMMDKQLILIRAGFLSAENTRLAEALNLRERVLVMSPESDKMPLLYNAADVLFFPSYYEGFGLPVLEAMACGTPVITSNTSSIPEVAGDAAIVHRPDDTESFADSIEQVFGSDTFARTLAKKGLRRASLFTWEACAEKTWAVYETILRR